MYSLDEDIYPIAFNQMQEFECGNDTMSNYLKQSAYHNHITYEENTTLVFRNGVLVGYFTLKMDTIDIPDMSFRATELTRIAVDIEYQTGGIGVTIMDYIKFLVNQLNVRYITTNALLEYLDWYMNRGFSVLSDEDIEDDSPTVYMYTDLYDEDAVDRYFDE